MVINHEVKTDESVVIKLALPNLETSENEIDLK